MAHALLAAVAAHYLLGPDLHTKAALVIAAHRLQKLGQIAQAVLPVFGVFCGIDQGFFDMLLRCKIRCTNGKIIDLFPLRQQFVFALVQRSENFIAEKLQSFGKFHDSFNPFLI